MTDPKPPDPAHPPVTPPPGASHVAGTDTVELDLPPILDAAVPTADLAQMTFDAERLIAANPTRDLDERLEAFENIIDSEIGDTILVRARNLEREVGKRQLYLKFEGGNTTGTQKDRIAFAQSMDALRRGFDTDHHRLLRQLRRGAGLGLPLREHPLPGLRAGELQVPAA